MTQDANPAKSPRRLQRTHTGRMVAGVCSGIAAYAGIDATIVRLLVVVLTVLGGSGAVIYLASWLLMPDEGEDRSVVQRMLKQ